MTERPILFSDAMVRAILDGRKTQTRRVARLAPGDVLTHVGRPCPRRDWPGSPACRPDDPRRTHHAHMRQEGGRHEYEMQLQCPYGAPGDLLWVREAWRPAMYRWESRVEYRAEGGPTLNVDRDDVATVRRIAFRGIPDLSSEAKARHSEAWHPSIHMPRWASRLTLRVTSVRVERVQAIDDADACAEGLSRAGQHPTLPWDPVAAFAALWDSINGDRRGCSWADDPWVWVVSFERVTP